MELEINDGTELDLQIPETTAYVSTRHSHSGSPACKASAPIH